MSAPHQRSYSMDDKDRFDFDGTQDSEEDDVFLQPPTGSPPTTPHRRNPGLGFGLRRGNVTPTTPTTPTSRDRHSSLSAINELRPLSPTRIRGASSPALLDPHSPTKITKKVAPVIHQVGRPRPDEVSKESPLSKQLAKLAVSDKQKASEDQSLFAVIVPDSPPLELGNAAPPEGPLATEPKRIASWSPMKPRSRTSSISSLNALSGFGNSQIDAELIYLTPTSQLPHYPRMGTPEYYAEQAARPHFSSDRVGYLSRSPLTNRIVQLFRDPRTAPQWKGTIPDIFAARQKEKGVDVAADQWVLYWETLIIKADVRRGCELAVKAAEMLRSEREQALAEHCEQVDTSFDRRFGRRLTGA